jgi:DNA-binding GntR family transcriptional regulator|tara:strand:+ start:173 stop:820 length:648 start_codon:yes stop_codon:yes gene_type:complete
MPTSLPDHEITYRKARDLILFGELAPGEAVTINGIVERLGTGITPAREAIRRLTAEGALRACENRRLMVPELTLEQLQELTYARTGIEPQIARLAAVGIEPADIDALEQIDAQVNAALSAGDIRAYLCYNHVFHWTLYAHSEAEILMATAASHWLRVGPSLRGMVKRNQATPMPDMHEVTIEALRDGDYEAVGEAIHNDILQGHANIAEGISSAD